MSPRINFHFPRNEWAQTGQPSTIAHLLTGTEPMSRHPGGIVFTSPLIDLIVAVMQSVDNSQLTVICCKLTVLLLVSACPRPQGCEVAEETSQWAACVLSLCDVGSHPIGLVTTVSNREQMVNGCVTLSIDFLTQEPWLDSACSSGDTVECAAMLNWLISVWGFVFIGGTSDLKHLFK